MRRATYYSWLCVLALISVIILSPKFVELIHVNLLNEFLDGLLGSSLRAELGGALFIAFILALLVDSYIKNRLVTEVAEDVLAFAAGHFLPAKTKNHVQNLIQSPWHRPRFEMRFSLVPLRRPDTYC
jgi:hypothetical protein